LIVASRALDTTQVRVDASEPLDPASVQKEDFTLTMAGVQRTIDSVSVAPDGRFVTLSSSGWKAGEAGYVDLAGPGRDRRRGGQPEPGRCAAARLCRPRRLRRPARRFASR